MSLEATLLPKNELLGSLSDVESYEGVLNEPSIDWKILQEPWDSLSGWTKSGRTQGVSEISPAGQLHQYEVSPYGVSRYKYAPGGLNQTIMVSLAKLKLDNTGPGGMAYFIFNDGMHDVRIRISTGAVCVMKTNLTYTCFDLTTTQGQFYEWLFIIKSQSHILDVCRDGQFVGGFSGTDIFFNTESYSGKVAILWTGTGDMWLDYWNITDSFALWLGSLEDAGLEVLDMSFTELKGVLTEK